MTEMKATFIINTSFQFKIEDDPIENYADSDEVLFHGLEIKTVIQERNTIRKICELFSTRNTRLSVYSTAGVFKKSGYSHGNVACNGSVFCGYPDFKEQITQI